LTGGRAGELRPRRSQDLTRKACASRRLRRACSEPTDVSTAALDGGRSWSLVVKGDGPGEDRPSPRCNASDKELAGPSLTDQAVEMSQSPHIAFHSDGGAWTPIFAEQYFPIPASTSQSTRPAAIQGLSVPSTRHGGVHRQLRRCAPAGTAPWAIAERGGKELVRRGNVGHITSSLGASFVTSRSGWVTGIYWMAHRLSTALCTRTTPVVHGTVEYTS